MDVPTIVNAGTSNGSGRNPTLVIPVPFDERKKNPADVLYCSGQITLADGRVFIVGGATYQNLGQSNEVENGVSYARIFDPDTERLEATSDAEIGGMWYPTAARLLNGDVLVTGGFARCCQGDPDANDNVVVFKPATNSWSKLGLVNDHLITPGLKDYTHVWVLPQPININNVYYQVAMMGYKGTVVYYNTDPSFTGQRYIEAPNGNRRISGTNGAWDTTAAYLPTGEFMINGGGEHPWRMDLFNPNTNSWRSFDTTKSRDNSASILLPDGTILLINGQNRYAANETPNPQIFDPFTGNIQTLPNWSDDGNWRGYHSWGILLKDGRVLLGGGTDNSGHSIACERVDLRVFTPPYLRPSSSQCVRRPIITSDPEPSSPIVFKVRADGGGRNAVTVISVGGAAIRDHRGAALMAFGSSTHSFDQNQRYVPVNVLKGANGNGTVELSVAEGQVVPGGVYNLFLVAVDGTPSVGRLARVEVV
ncbi:hypothetical protein HDU67_009748 [Dinochytrium kinnereticum]|nr:hypothetical protein HDU67_009748 [Dinochytrium kinnereticum]